MSSKVSAKELISSLQGLTIRSAAMSPGGWVIVADGANCASCPSCTTISQSRHSRYKRRLQDLPLQGVAVTLHLHLSRWRCRNDSCNRRIFAERLIGMPVPYARHTKGVAETKMLMGRALGGRPGARLARRLGVPVSRQTLLRQVKSAARTRSADPALRAVGVDDWAWKKGCSYGTIVVDLERNEVVDVLSTRSSAALRDWLTANPGVVVVARDRQGEYADGARQGAPQAMQVADRFHLLQNLREAVERALAVQRRHLRMPLAQASGDPAAIPGIATPVVVEENKRALTCVERNQVEAGRQSRQQKLELFETARQMKAAGLKVSQIARQLGVNRRRLDKWVRLEVLPERSRMVPRPGMVESYRGYLRQRWEAGIRNGRLLFAEIQGLGYRGGYSHLATLLSPWRREGEVSVEPTEVLPTESGQPIELPVVPQTPDLGRQISPQVASALLVKNPEELTPEQAETVATLKQQCPGFAEMRHLALSFRGILRAGTVATLHRWMEDAAGSGIHAMERFVLTLKKDLKAVEAAVSERWSNGPVEGQINRLKMLKRQMYGRAGIELLRARMLPEPASIAA